MKACTEEHCFVCHGFIANCRCRCDEQQDDEDDDREAPHICVYVGVDDHDECDVCGRSADQFADLPDHMLPDFDGGMSP